MNALRLLAFSALVCSSVSIAQAEVTDEQFAALDKKVQAQNDALQGLLVELREMNRQLGARIDSVDRERSDETRTLRELAQKVQNQIDTFEQRVEYMLRQIADQDNHQFAPNLLGNMSTNPEFKNRFGKAVRGKLVIDNQWMKNGRIFINGTPWRFDMGRSEIPMTFGTVTIHRESDRKKFEFSERDWVMRNGEPVLSITYAVPVLDPQPGP